MKVIGGTGNLSLHGVGFFGAGTGFQACFCLFLRGYSLEIITPKNIVRSLAKSKTSERA